MAELIKLISIAIVETGDNKEHMSVIESCASTAETIHYLRKAADMIANDELNGLPAGEASHG